MWNVKALIRGVLEKYSHVMMAELVRFLYRMRRVQEYLHLKITRHVPSHAEEQMLKMPRHSLIQSIYKSIPRPWWPLKLIEPPHCFAPPALTSPTTPSTLSPSKIYLFNRTLAKAEEVAASFPSYSIQTVSNLTVLPIAPLSIPQLSMISPISRQ